jgi:hypothetical protein
MKQCIGQHGFDILVDITPLHPYVMCPHEMHVLKLVEFSSMLQGQSK